MRPLPPHCVEVVAMVKEAETEKAVRYRVEIGGCWTGKWFPKSLLLEVDEMDDGSALLLIPEWLARERGLVCSPQRG